MKCNDVEKDVIFALSLYEDDAVYEVALVTNHRYKKFARTGHPSGPTKFSFFCRCLCDAGEAMKLPRGASADADEEELGAHVGCSLSKKRASRLANSKMKCYCRSTHASS